MTHKIAQEMDHCTVYWPRILTPLIKQRLVEEHYQSEGKFFAALLILDLTGRCKHWLTSQLMSGPVEIRIQVNEEIIREFDNLPSKVAGRFRKRIERIVEGYHTNRKPGKKKREARSSS